MRETGIETEKRSENVVGTKTINSQRTLHTARFVNL